MKKCLVLVVSVLLLAACTSKQDKLFKQAQLATDKGEFTKAIQLYTAVLKKNPKHIAARTNRGVLFERLKTKSARERLKNQKLAEQDYVQALEGAPNVPETYNNLGALLLDMGRYSDAVYYLQRATNIRPKYFMAWMNLGIAYYQQGRITESLTSFAKAYNIRQDYPMFFLNRGLAYFALGDYEAAVADYTTLLRLQGPSARALLERGRAFAKMKYYANAMDDFEQAAHLKPTYALAYYYMGELLFQRGETDAALGMLAKTKELASKYVPAYDLMGDMLALEDPQGAVANYLVARKLDPANAAKYEYKMRMMRTAAGRKAVVARRFL